MMTSVTVCDHRRKKAGEAGFQRELKGLMINQRAGKHIQKQQAVTEQWRDVSRVLKSVV